MRNEERGRRGKKPLYPLSFNSLDANFSPVVDVSIIIFTVIKHFGNVGNFLFLKPLCQLVKLSELSRTKSPLSIIQGVVRGRRK